MQIYHNPRCRKSRETLELLTENGQEPEVILYLQTPPTRKELQALLRKLQIPAESLLRKGEAIYKEHFKGKNLSEEEWIEAMVEHPILIERPIVVQGDRAVIGRPPERVLELLK
ncbi:MAG: arsenate reductase (glutaredoxin) [Saprospiraceae bacterium]|nr:arsenate reductase (glutaredoxin) [Saprospiraceae bacterium]MCB0684782.1 arsenate reductase (glutaredoxin) [Saprospiraceae bacterium]